MKTSPSSFLQCYGRQLKIQGMLWLGIVAEISLMALLVREVQPLPEPPMAAWNVPAPATGPASFASPASLLAQGTTSLR